MISTNCKFTRLIPEFEHGFLIRSNSNNIEASSTLTDDFSSKNLRKYLRYEQIKFFEQYNLSEKAIAFFRCDLNKFYNDEKFHELP